MFLCHEGYAGPACTLFEPDALFAHRNAQLRTLQGRGIVGSLLLPCRIRSFPGLRSFRFVERFGRQDFYFVLDAQGRQQLVVDDVALVPHLCKAESQLFQLQFVASQVVAQHHTFGFSFAGMCNEGFGQSYVLVEHPFLIPQIVQLQVVARQQHPHALSVVRSVGFSHVFGQPTQVDAALDGPSRVDGHRGLQGKVVAVVRDVYAESVSEVAVGDAPPAQVSERGRRIHVGQPFGLGSPHAGLSLAQGRFITLDGGVVLVGCPI